MSMTIDHDKGVAVAAREVVDHILVVSERAMAVRQRGKWWVHRLDCITRFRDRAKE